MQSCPEITREFQIKDMDSLLNANLKYRVNLGRMVLVVGGGNVAVDVARSALRLGARDVSLECLESRREMPAFEVEFRAELGAGGQGIAAVMIKNEERCIRCGLCEQRCPVDCITMEGFLVESAVVAA